MSDSNRLRGKVGNWRFYEDQIRQRLQRIAGPDAEVLFDQKVLGRLSQRLRQVDVLVKGPFAGGMVRVVTMAVDCKCWARRVTVDDVDRFAGFVQDVGTDLGLLVTTSGYSRAARIRAENSGLRLDIVDYEELESWEPPLVICPMCTDSTSDRFPGMAWVISQSDDVPGHSLIDGTGECEKCGTPIWLCSCGAANAVWEHEIGLWSDCQGACGIESRFNREYDRKGLPTSQGWEFRRADNG